MKKSTWFLLILLCSVITLIIYHWAPVIGAMSYTQLSQIVTNEMLMFATQEISSEILTQLAEYKVVMVGEYHNIKEHHTFLRQLTTALHADYDFNHLLLEMPQAFNWIFQAYTAGDIPEVTPETAETFWFYVAELPLLRAYNLTLPPADRVQVNTIDINHSPYYFVSSLEYMQNFLPNPALLQTYTAKLRANAENDDAYLAELNQFAAKLQEESDIFSSELTTPWYERIVVMVDAEQYSFRCRAYLKNNQQNARMVERETFIKQQADNYLQEAVGGTLINMGANHVQKTPLRGTKIEWIAEYLCTTSPYAQGQTYCLLVIPAQGTISATQDYPSLAAGSASNELFRLIAEQAQDKRGFLSFNNHLLATEKVLMNFRFDQKSFPPKQLYDGVLVLPEGTYSSPFTD